MDLNNYEKLRGLMPLGFFNIHCIYALLFIFRKCIGKRVQKI